MHFDFTTPINYAGKIQDTAYMVMHQTTPIHELQTLKNDPAFSGPSDSFNRVSVAPSYSSLSYYFDNEVGLGMYFSRKRNADYNSIKYIKFAMYSW